MKVLAFILIVSLFTTPAFGRLGPGKSKPNEPTEEKSDSINEQLERDIGEMAKKMGFAPLAETGQAKPVDSAYIRNSGTTMMQVWINGSYQGQVKPGETRYSVSDGFITDDSDRPTADGKRTPVEESHGGWANLQKKVVVTFQFAGGEMQQREFALDASGKLIFAGTDKTKGPLILPTDIELETAPAILKGRGRNLDGAFTNSQGPLPAFGIVSVPAANRSFTPPVGIQSTPGRVRVDSTTVTSKPANSNAGRSPKKPEFSSTTPSKSTVNPGDRSLEEALNSPGKPRLPYSAPKSPRTAVSQNKAQLKDNGAEWDALIATGRRLIERANAQNIAFQELDRDLDRHNANKVRGALNPHAFNAEADAIDARRTHLRLERVALEREFEEYQATRAKLMQER